MGQLFNAVYFGVRCKWLRMRLRRAHRRQVRESLRELRILDAGLGNGWDILAATVYVNVSLMYRRVLQCSCSFQASSGNKALHYLFVSARDSEQAL